MKLNTIALALATLLCTTAQAAERVWDGATTAAHWSTVITSGPSYVTNWSLSTPTAPGRALNNGDSLVFGASWAASGINDYTGLSIAGMKFRSDAIGYALWGNRLVSTGDVLNASSQNQSLAFDSLVVGADQRWDGGKAGMTVYGFALDEHSLVLAGKLTLDNLAMASTTIGRTGDARLLAGAGVTLASHTTFIAGAAGFSAQVLMTDGARWNSDGLFYVGSQGKGQLDLQRGASIYSKGGHVGRFAGSTGQVNINGAESRWVSADPASIVQIGYEGSGSVNVFGGALWAPAVNLGYNGGRGSLTVSGATAQLRGSSGGSINMVHIGNSLGWGAVSLDAGAQLRASTVHIEAPNAGSDGLGSWLRQGDGTGAYIDNVIVGPDGRWSLGGDAYAEAFYVGVGSSTSANASGQARMDLGGTARVSMVGLNVGSRSQGLVSVGSGAQLSVGGTLTIGNQGQLLIDGGRVSAGALALASGGQLDWRSGRLALDGSSGLDVSAASASGAVFVVPQAGVLSAAKISLGAGGVLVNSTGGQVQTRWLRLSGGSWVGDLSLADVPMVTGSGQVLGQIMPGSANKSFSIVATGALSLGSLLAQDAVQFGSGVAGQIHVQRGASLQLQSANAVELPRSTTLEGSATLAALNGLRLGADSVLSAAPDSGTSWVRGDFVNDGHVAAADGAQIDFMDAVSGSGDFAGHVVFRQGFDGGAASTAFQGGMVEFDAGSTLDLSVGAARAGKLAGIGRLSFAGTLALHFDSGFAAVAAGGMRIDLLDFDSLDGFSADQVRVTGFDKSRLDFSHFAGEGVIEVSAVPEPSSALLMLLGVAGLLAWRRR